MQSYSKVIANEKPTKNTASLGFKGFLKKTLTLSCISRGVPRKSIMTHSIHK